MKIHPGDLIVGILMVCFLLVGAVLAVRAVDSEMIVFGLSLAGFAILFLIGQVRRQRTSPYTRENTQGDRHNG